MSLITNEIHVRNGFKNTVLVFAADRLITKPNRPPVVRPKLFKIPYLEAGISYFGLAEVFPSGRTVYMSDWLQYFINRQAGIRELGEFAFKLRDALHLVIPLETLQANASGFHICGYTLRGLPDFWYLSNIGGMEQYWHTGLMPRYEEPQSHFLERDAKELGWDGKDVSSVQNKGRIYRNGDFRGHVVAWDALGQILENMQSFPDFKKQRTVEDYETTVKFKFKVIERIYKEFCRKPKVGGGVDVFTITKTLP